MNTVAVPTDTWIRVGTLEELREQGCLVVRGADRPVVVFYDEGQVRALDNRCPHLGFPLSRGSLKDGIVTCPWHNARFDAAGGCAFDMWADDIPPFDSEVRGDEVWVSAYPRPCDPRSYGLRRLRDGMEQNLSLICAKAILTLLNAGVSQTDIARAGAQFGALHREDFGSGLVILTALARTLPHLSEENTYLALFQGIRNIAEECDRQPGRRPRPRLEACNADQPRLTQWMIEWTRGRHRDGIERTLRTQIDSGAGPRETAEMVLTAALARPFAEGGHTLDFCNKAFELLDLVGWDMAADILPALAPSLARSRGGEESSAWRQPIDLIELVRIHEARLRQHFDRRTESVWAEETELAEKILQDDPETVLASITEAAEQGATPEQLGKALAYAAIVRIARFGPSNEFSDWITALHTFTYCQAMSQALRRCPSPSLVSGVLHGAVAIYLDRFLNVPLRAVPNGKRYSGDLTRLREDGPQRLLELLDSRQMEMEAANLVAAWAVAGHPADPLIDALARAVVREDADFHTYQMLEAGVQLLKEWTIGSEQGRVVLVAMARYIAAMSPTARASYQTATVALRLHRGDRLHEEP